VDSETFYLLLAIVGAGLGIIFVRRFLSPEARERRRRQRSYGKTVQKMTRPTVKFTVKTPDEEK